MRHDWMGISPKVLWMGRQASSVQYSREKRKQLKN